jgi:hypothetical protein
MGCDCHIELVFKAWKSHLHLATLPTTTKNSTLWYLYGRLLLIVVTFALGAPVRTTVWQTQQREVSLIKLVRHFQAGAEQWFRVLFQSPPSAHDLPVVGLRGCRTISAESGADPPHLGPTLTRQLGAASRFF